MKTREEIKEIVNKLTPEECYMFISEIVYQDKIVLYGNWYSKDDIKSLVDRYYPEYIRDRKINGLLEDETFDFDEFYEDLSSYSSDKYDGPSDDFINYILPEFMEEENEEEEI
ncbi:hypothetical protein UFOVP163_21 [uncultured Caudovirales phage]|uniref:Uncharacterized protein n=1 Tax=uncultured Caudovirales phage TaxID=2100421 RepID=A0A6J7WDA1_9CAUD|nr:hypothetical protein UFOVP163_21 [uncultured Caudovirales phage]